MKKNIARICTAALAVVLNVDLAVAASIPSLPCPLGSTCKIGGYRFGDTWREGTCPSPLYKIHTGVDLKATAGTAVYAVADGMVALVYSAGTGWGSAILVESRDFTGAKWTAQYMHVTALVAAGTIVKKGQKIATVAPITGAHLHFAIWNASSGYREAQRGALPNGQGVFTLGSGTTCNGDRPFRQAFVNPTAYIPAY